MELSTIKNYIRVDYDDDDQLIELMHEAVVEEMKELIPKFNEEKPTNRQKLLILAYVKELYDNRNEISEKGVENVRFAVRSMMLKEMLR